MFWSNMGGQYDRTLKKWREIIKGDGHLIIYGAGLLGERLLEDIRLLTNMTVDYFVDRRANEIGNVGGGGHTS